MLRILALSIAITLAAGCYPAHAYCGCDDEWSYHERVSPPKRQKPNVRSAYHEVHYGSLNDDQPDAPDWSLPPLPPFPLVIMVLAILAGGYLMIMFLSAVGRSIGHAVADYKRRKPPAEHAPEGMHVFENKGW
jgi:hypothetical protein